MNVLVKGKFTKENAMHLKIVLSFLFFLFFLSFVSTIDGSIK